MVAVSQSRPSLPALPRPAIYALAALGVLAVLIGAWQLGPIEALRRE